MQFNSDGYEPREFAAAPAGDYDFTVASGDDFDVNGNPLMSKKGNEMISLELAVFVPGRDNPIKVYDYLVSVDAALWKIDGFCKATGLNKAFLAGDLTAQMCIGKAGQAHFEPELGQDGKNYLKVKYYIERVFTEQPVKSNLTPAQTAKLKAAEAKLPNKMKPKPTAKPKPELELQPADLNDDIPF